MATNVNFDEQHNVLLLVLAALSLNSDVCKLVIDKLSPNIINIMKTIKEICGVSFKLKHIDDDYMKMKSERFQLLKDEDLRNDIVDGQDEEYSFRIILTECVGISQMNIYRETF